MKQTVPAIAFAAALVVLSQSCSSQLKRKFLDEPYRDKAVSAPLVITGVEIVDARGSADRGTLAIPSFTFKTVGDTVSPPLTQQQEAAIKEEVARYAAGTGVEARVRVTLKAGEKQYSMGFFHSRESAKAVVGVELLDGVSVPYLFSTGGEAYYEMKSAKADTLFLEALYRKALRTCIWKAFESVEVFFEKRGGK